MKTTAQLVKAMKDEFTATCEAMLLTAQTQRVYFEALKKEGFTEHQALELTKSYFKQG